MSYDESDMMESLLQSCLKGMGCWNCKERSIDYLEKQIERGQSSKERVEEMKEQIKQLNDASGRSSE